MKGFFASRHQAVSVDIESVMQATGTPTLSLDQVYRQHAGDVTRWATRLTGNPDEALDITHEVFCVAQRRLSSFRPDSAKVSTWLFSITRNLSNSRRRHQRLKERLFTPLDETSAEVPSAHRAPDEALHTARQAEQCYRVLDRLNEASRTVLVLFELEGYSGEQIAELTGTKVGTVWVRLHRAREQFLRQHRELEKAGQL